jgi:hypothetical protein
VPTGSVPAPVQFCSPPAGLHVPHIAQGLQRLSPQDRMTTSRYGRIVRRSVAQEYLDRVRAYRATPAYHKALRKRSVWIEPLVGEAKQWHQLVQFRLRRLENAAIQALLIAAGQNIKRLLRRKERPKPLKPGAAQVLDVPATLVNAVSRCFLSFGSKISCHQPVVLRSPGTSARTIGNGTLDFFNGLMCTGTRRSQNRRVKHANTSSWVRWRLTTVARHSRVYSSITLRSETTDPHMGGPA